MDIKSKKIKIGRKSFTLIELMVGIVIVAILSIATITIINPAEFIKQMRDNNRLADITSINNAIRFLTENEPGTFIGTSSVVYVSIPDISSTCDNLGLPILPDGWSYGCVDNLSVGRVDGTGWIPVNFGHSSAGSSISRLPVDSKNSTSTGNYFTYVASGNKWALAFSPEAENNKLGGANNLTIKDRGQKLSLFEVGTDLSLLPIDYGDPTLVAYWSFNDGFGVTTFDGSGHGRGGEFISEPVWIPECVIGPCLQFDNKDDGVDIPGFNFAGVTDYSLSAWIKLSGDHKNFAGTIMSSGDWNNRHWAFTLSQTNTIVQTRKADGSSYPTFNYVFSLDRWYLATLVRKGTSVFAYVDGVLVGGSTLSSGALVSDTTNMTIGRESFAGGAFVFNGLIDDPRVYNRALSGVEVSAIYNAVR